MKGRRDGVQEEAADEFVGRQRHRLALIGITPVAVRERDDAVADREEPVVGDGDAMGIAAEVVEDGSGAGEGTFGIDDPVLGVELTEQAAEGWFIGEPRRSS